MTGKLAHINGWGDETIFAIQHEHAKDSVHPMKCSDVGDGEYYQAKRKGHQKGKLEHKDYEVEKYVPQISIRKG